VFFFVVEINSTEAFCLPRAATTSWNPNSSSSYY